MDDNKTELEKAINRGLYGNPELKKEEKQIFLGEFRERVFLVLEKEEVNRLEALDYIKKIMNNDDIDRVIVNRKYISENINKEYMSLAREFNKEYKAYFKSYDNSKALVLASKKPLLKENIKPDILFVPDEYKEFKGQKICEDCYSEIKKKHVEKYFKKIGYLDKFFGVKCAICSSKRK